MRNLYKVQRSDRLPKSERDGKTRYYYDGGQHRLRGRGKRHDRIHRMPGAAPRKNGVSGYLTKPMWRC